MLPEEPPAIVPVHISPPIPPARFLVTQTVLWQPTQGQAVDVVPHREGSFTRMLNTDEQVWSRNQTIPQEWTMVDLGWVGESGHCSQLILLNQEGQFLQRIPTPEARKAAFAKHIEIAFGLLIDQKPDIYIAPLENCRFTPGGRTIYARAPNGPAKLTVVAIPGEEVRIDG